MSQLSTLLEDARQYSPVTMYTTCILVAAMTFLLSLYRIALPKPIPGIPYNKDSASKLFGDGQAYVKHCKEYGGTFATYCQSVAKSLDAPLVQIFIQPFKRPLLVLADFRETEALMRRKDFDRSDDMGDMILGLMPQHHLRMKTNSAWKSQRLLTKGLMLPSWLHGAAAPEICQHALSMIELWEFKARIADGRPFEAAEDLRRMAMNAVMSFCFGQRFQDIATGPAIEALQARNSNLAKPDEPEQPIEFPTTKLNPLLGALDTLFESVGKIRGSPKPSLTWAYILRKPHYAHALRLKNAYISAELQYAMEQLQESQGDDTAKSAVHHMVLREKDLAQREKREPHYVSQVMMDELYGFIFAGMDTTSTSMSWGVKFLADNSRVTTRLRAALRVSFAAAVSEDRNPTVEEIVKTSVPYLEATLEEIHRCGGTTPIVDRQAVVDTQLLGHLIPQKTNVACLTMGPSMMEPGFDIDEAHRHEKTCGTDSEMTKHWDVNDIALFKPERWMKDGRFDPGSGPQLAFGLGLRACCGKRLAYLNMRVLFALLVWNFELLPSPEILSDYSSKLIVTNRPTKCYIRLQKISTRHYVGN
ncbi:hypothetical protein FE257_000905 [Aspergillus nanangensis]|uniref:Cytochrome P450 monooxygenase n=1 Tax=Aspergillus nanangensis TaxID=2582783 RepID=A0AAD4CEC5_ASPNN|nr:hypothetical protein FE257_000905 [Aspergillus nanangensis]